MEATRIAALVCYALVALGQIAVGAVYLLRPRFMPYHEQVVGGPWHELDSRFQALVLGLMRSVGGGMVGGGISLLILLLVPYRTGETWSLLALPLVGLATVLPTTYGTVFVRSRTGAPSPVAACVAGVALLGIGLALSVL